jgi:hypothetical protein
MRTPPVYIPRVLHVMFCLGSIGSPLLGLCAFSDTTAPVPLCPADIAVEATADSGTAASSQVIVDFLAGASATDTVDPSPTLAHDRTGLDPWPVGATTTTFTATDVYGNAASCTAIVTVSGAIRGFSRCSCA